MRLEDTQHSSDAFLHMLLGIVSVKRRLGGAFDARPMQVAEASSVAMSRDPKMWATLGVVALWQAASKTLAEFAHDSPLALASPSRPHDLSGRQLLR